MFITNYAYTTGVLLLAINVCQCTYEADDKTKKDAPYPVVLWHGMGDSCCFSFSIGQIKTILEDEMPGVYVKSIRIGRNEIEDVERSYFDNINDQIARVCDELSADERLRGGYHAIGFSQGAQFLRAVAERCSNQRMINLISLGGQHQGVYGLPHCSALENRLCDFLIRMLNYGAYLPILQRKIVQASYWHDPLAEEEYKAKSILLADINNDNYLNETYKENLQKLKKLVLVRFEKDSMVRPAESEWFGFYKPGQTLEVIPMEDTDLYKEDRIGLRQMNEDGKIDFITSPTDHVQFTDEWFVANIINKYLK